jgi:hypothetical protein
MTATIMPAFGQCAPVHQRVAPDVFTLADADASG